MTRSARDPLYRRHRFPAEAIAHAVWLYFRFPLSLRMVEDILATRGIIVSHQTVRLWAEKFGRQFANDIRRRSAGRLGDKWYLDEVVITIGGKKHWLWRAVDHHGFVLDILLKSRRDAWAAKRLMRKLLKAFKSTRQLQRFVPIHDPIANLFQIPRHDIPSHHYRELRRAAMKMWSEITHLQVA
ncbi:IS6 family transposase [Agrobacterium vitis]|uniref:IS6 family transposase n=1 Tax=Agrobacterium vitis TaxID=373 RepID=A0ABD6G8G2_AGRVI|nr:IS6 family transposase [Agrobacterium vitis]MUO80753.1 IS6 family transposase [Agrobacterium vitis]MUO97984.1 IS6 family transposase [Agrobacterium vitis]MUP05577.1 IS6 family transposase [Agrobacterium vitis]MUZ81429.1 IS6 family transposase [Agrobacterium vitis]MVA95422.1 IS6 family transposase [Agrobacterium vitis]